MFGSRWQLYWIVFNFLWYNVFVVGERFVRSNLGCRYFCSSLHRLADIVGSRAVSRHRCSVSCEQWFRHRKESWKLLHKLASHFRRTISATSKCSISTLDIIHVDHSNFRSSRWNLFKSCNRQVWANGQTFRLVNGKWDFFARIP